MKRIPQIKSVMTPFPYSIDIDMSLDDAVKMMHAQHIRHLPVSRTGQLVGIVSERHIRLAVESGHEKNTMRVRDVCVFDSYTVELSERLDNVLLRMAEEHIGSALIVKQGKLVGIFTITDACRCFAEYLQAQFPDGGGNEAA